MHRALLALALVVGCRGKAEPAPSAAPSTSGSVAVAASASESASPDDDVKPVYPLDVPEEPLARRVCGAVQETFLKQRGTCCGDQALSGSSQVLVSECVRNLSAAIAAKAVTVNATDLAKCAEETTKVFAGCAWVGPHPPPLPASCRNLLVGTIGEGKTCRSSLECVGELHCEGVGPTSAGTCRKPRATGGCGRTVDPLALYTRQAFDESHPECTQRCGKIGCVAPKAAGEACTVASECQKGHVCVGAKCTPVVAAKVGDPCPTGACVEGAACARGKCVSPKPAGEKCDDDLECQGGCVKGTCGTRCF